MTKKSIDVKVLDTGDIFVLEDDRGTWWGLGTLVDDFVDKRVRITVEVLEGV